MKLRNLLLVLLLAFSLLLAACHFAPDTTEPNRSDKQETEESTVADKGDDVPSDDCTPLLYRVTDANGNTVWLFGSIHVGRAGMETLPDYVMDAYNRSEALAVECDILTFQQDFSAMVNALSYLVYTDGTTIKDHLPTEVYNDAATILRINKQYVLGIDSYKPMMWSSTIDSLAVTRSGLSSDMGVDLQFLTRAHDEGKKILEVESADFQYAMMGSFSPELQTMLLTESVMSYQDKTSDQSLLELVDAWCSGDIQKLKALTAFDYEGATAEERVLLEEYQKAMLTDRDAGMTAFAEDCLSQGKEVFICVGAAHVVGDGGIAASLSAKGYTVEAIRGES